MTVSLNNNILISLLQIIQKLNIIPFSVEKVDEKVNEFGSYSEEIRRNIPEILVATMNILQAQCQEVK